MRRPCSPLQLAHSCVECGRARRGLGLHPVRLAKPLTQATCPLLRGPRRPRGHRTCRALCPAPSPFPPHVGSPGGPGLWLHRPALCPLHLRRSCQPSGAHAGPSTSWAHLPCAGHPVARGLAGQPPREEPGFYPVPPLGNLYVHFSEPLGWQLLWVLSPPTSSCTHTFGGYFCRCQQYFENYCVLVLLSPRLDDRGLPCIVLSPALGAIKAVSDFCRRDKVSHRCFTLHFFAY